MSCSNSGAMQSIARVKWSKVTVTGAVTYFESAIRNLAGISSEWVSEWGVGSKRHFNTKWTHTRPYSAIHAVNDRVARSQSDHTAGPYIVTADTAADRIFDYSLKMRFCFDQIRAQKIVHSHTNAYFQVLDVFALVHSAFWCHTHTHSWNIERWCTATFRVSLPEIPHFHRHPPKHLTPSDAELQNLEWRPLTVRRNISSTGWVKGAGANFLCTQYALKTLDVELYQVRLDNAPFNQPHPPWRA